MQFANIKAEFYSEPVYNKKVLKAKIKPYNGKINTTFCNTKKQKESSKSICLSVILVDSVFRTGKNYYPQVFLEECKYVVKKKRCLSILLTTYKFLMILIEKVLMKKTLLKIILRKKNLMKKIKYRICLFLYLQHFE